MRVMPVTQHYSVIARRHPLTGKTMGIVGYGRIGRRVGELARAFGMAILAYDLAPGSSPAESPVTWCELDDLFAPAREAWRGAVHLERESWRGNDEAWRGDEHLADWPEHAAGPEYWMFKGMTDRS